MKVLCTLLLASVLLKINESFLSSLLFVCWSKLFQYTPRSKLSLLEQELLSGVAVVIFLTAATTTGPFPLLSSSIPLLSSHIPLLVLSFNSSNNKSFSLINLNERIMDYDRYSSLIHSSPLLLHIQMEYGVKKYMK